MSEPKSKVYGSERIWELAGGGELWIGVADDLIIGVAEPEEEDEVGTSWSVSVPPAEGIEIALHLLTVSWRLFEEQSKEKS